MKKLLAILLTLSILFCFSACKDKNEEKETPKSKLSVSYMTGPTGVGMAKLRADFESGKTINDYQFTVAASADDFKKDFIAGNINIVSAPTNVAAALYNETKGDVRILAVNTYGVLSILENGDSIKSISDLKGKTIYSTGKGQNPEYILKYILQKNNIDPENDVTINFVDGNELVAKMISGEAQIAMAPEPAATTIKTKNNSINRALSINDEWSKVSDSKLMMGCVIARASFVEKNADAIDNFLKEYEQSIKFATENIDKTAEYCEKYKITNSAAIAKNAIPTCNLCFVTGNDMKSNVNDYLNVLFTANPKSIGGKIPADDIYYKAK